jgi:hypothetical protein
MADISNLSIAPTEPLDLDIYKSIGERKPFPGKGRYTLRAPEVFPSEAFASNKAGTALTVQIDPTIVGPTGEGKILRYTRISAKTFQRGGTIVSQLGDYLKACGQSGKVSGDPTDQANAAEATAGQVYEANLNWRLWKKGEGRTIDGDGNVTPTGDPLVIEGMENFPSDGNGGHVPYVESLTQVNEYGEPKRLWAELTIDSFVPRS